jgi:hypothetical protein
LVALTIRSRSCEWLIRVDLTRSAGARRTAALVKGFRTPASHWRAGVHGGRRPKSLEGGNRGGVCAGGGVGLWGFSAGVCFDASSSSRQGRLSTFGRSYIAKAHMHPGCTGEPAKAPVWYLSTKSSSRTDRKSRPTARRARRSRRSGSRAASMSWPGNYGSIRCRCARCWRQPPRNARIGPAASITGDGSAAEGPMVRRLSPGGSRIRTLRPTLNASVPRGATWVPRTAPGFGVAPPLS